MEILQVIIMVMQGVAASIFDMFFIMAALITWMMVLRLKTYSSLMGERTKKPFERTTELLVWSIMGGIVLSLIMTGLGLPIEYSLYLYYLLPLSFILGLLHTRYLDLIYSGSVLALVSLLLNGQELFGRSMPDIQLDLLGLALVVGLLKLVEGLMVALNRGQDMLPMVVRKGQDKYLGFFQFWIWPIPLVLLTYTMMTMEGETVAMPNWWPLMNQGEGQVMFLLPILLLLAHGDFIIGQKPKAYLKRSANQLLIMGLSLTLVAFIGILLALPDFVGLLALVIAMVYQVYVQVLAPVEAPMFRLGDPGLLVTFIAPGGKMETMGLQAGDRLLKINGQHLSVYETYILELAKGINSISYETPSGQVHQETFEKPLTLNDGLGITLLNEQHKEIFDYEEVKRMGLLTMGRLVKQIKE